MSLPTTPAKKALTALDHRIQAAVGRSVDALWEQHDADLLDEPSARLVDIHRDLGKAEISVTFYRKLLHRLTGGEFPVDNALFDRIGRTMDQLKDAADVRDGVSQKVITALESIEAAAEATPMPGEPLTPTDQAALLAIAGGAKLHEHLLTGRMSVTAASGTRIPYAELLRLENAGTVSRDVGHPVQAGQPVTLTDAGRAALGAIRQSPATQVTKTAARPGAWPSTSAQRR
ncbi:hypothetical protein [Streptomyces sp. SID1121]|uniref:hypothetical protein n=1 Tax=Streptomyces sp. SID1121 TaxID=3425888 RepID=UPI0040575F04